MSEKSMIITVGKLQVRHETPNWIVTSQRTKKTGETTEKICAYYPNLEGACRYLLKKRIDQKAKGELEDVIAIIEHCRNEVVNAIANATTSETAVVSGGESDCDW